MQGERRRIYENQRQDVDRSDRPVELSALRKQENTGTCNQR
jgi:hypothetical protein